jgi:hypothetical protein
LQQLGDLLFACLNLAGHEVSIVVLSQTLIGLHIDFGEDHALEFGVPVYLLLVEVHWVTAAVPAFCVSLSRSLAHRLGLAVALAVIRPSEGGIFRMSCR